MTDTQAEVMPDERAADFAALQAAAGEQETAQLEAAQALEPERPDLAKEIGGMLTLFVGMVGPLFPSLKEIYTEQSIAAVSGAAAAVCDKHGFLQGGIGGKYGEEIMLLIVAGPMAYATYTGIAGDLAARRAAEKPVESLSGPDLAPEVGRQSPPGANTVAFGTVGA